MKPPIAILFANLKGNIGDFAILHAMLLNLRRRFPDQPLHVFSHGFYEVDEKRFAAFRKLCEIEFELVGRTYFRKPAPKLLERAIKAVGLWPLAQAYLVKSLTEGVASHAARYREYDAIFLAGGEHWGGTEGGISMLGTLNAVHRHNDQIYAFPFSVRPRTRKFNRTRDLQRILQKIRKPLIVRDGITKSVMDNLGIASVLGADCVFSLQEVADRIKPMPNRNPSRILLAATGSRRHLESDLRHTLQQLRLSGTDIALMTTCEFEDGERFSAVARDLGVAFLAPATWQEAVAEIKASSLLVTNRLHGLILGSLARTPLLPIADRKKAEAFAGDAKMPHSVAGLRVLTRALIERCLADRGAILRQMSQYQAYASKAAYSPVS